MLADVCRLIEEVFELEALVNGALSHEQEDRYERLDAKREALSKKAERTCRRLKMGQVCWTPQYQEALMTHRFWELLYKKRLGRKIGAKYLRRVAIQVGLADHLDDPMHVVLEERDKAWKRYKEVKKNETSLRGKWLDDLAAARAEAGRESAAKGLIVLKARERQKHRARLLKSIMAPIDEGRSIHSKDSRHWTLG